MTGPDPVLSLLGLAARAGSIVSGTKGVRAAVRRGHAQLVILARDAAASSAHKLLPVLRAHEVPCVRAFQRTELGAAIGRAPVATVAVTKESFAARLQELLRGSVSVEEFG